MLAIAIDGPSGAGKSSIARRVAGELGFLYVDTGALYRTVALYLMNHGIDPGDEAAVIAALPQIEVSMKHTPQGQKMYLCSEDVTDKIRSQAVSSAAAATAAIPAVRAFLMELQRGLARGNNVLMDGRDIGTVVLPDAGLKIFLTASAEERARRRVRQLKEAGQSADFPTVLKEIEERDYQDSHREIAPLKPAEGSVTVDTTGESFEDSVRRILDIINKEYKG